MAKMNERMQEIFNKQQIIALATTTREGEPNVVPVGAKRIIDEETIIISNQYFKKTLANILENPRVALTFWDGSEGYQIKGTVKVETSGPIFEETAVWVDLRGKAMNRPLKSKGAVILKIDEIYYVTPGPKAGKRID